MIYLEDCRSQKTAWPIWLGDHYNKGNLNINQVVKILGEKLSDELENTEEADPVKIYHEFIVVWNKFCQGAKFGDETYFENIIFRAIPELKKMIDKDVT